MTAALLFAATFGVVFALGLQSLNVNGGHRRLAFVTSLLIGTSNLVLFKVLPGPTEWLEIVAYLTGGPFGIVCSMAAHPWLVARLGRQSPPAPPAPAQVPAPAAEHVARAGHSACASLALDLLDPEMFGHACSSEVRTRARVALAIDGHRPQDWR